MCLYSFNIVGRSMNNGYILWFKFLYKDCISEKTTLFEILIKSGILPKQPDFLPQVWTLGHMSATLPTVVFCLFPTARLSNNDQQTVLQFGRFTIHVLGLVYVLSLYITQHNLTVGQKSSILLSPGSQTTGICNQTGKLSNIQQTFHTIQ